MPLISVMTTSTGTEPWSAYSSTELTYSASGWICRTTSEPATKIATSSRPMSSGETTGRRWASPRVMRPRWRRPDANAPTTHTPASTIVET